MGLGRLHIIVKVWYLSNKTTLYLFK